jgi:hypothetical protein
MSATRIARNLFDRFIVHFVRATSEHRHQQNERTSAQQDDVFFCKAINTNQPAKIDPHPAPLRATGLLTSNWNDTRF